MISAQDDYNYSFPHQHLTSETTSSKTIVGNASHFMFESSMQFSTFDSM